MKKVLILLLVLLIMLSLGAGLFYVLSKKSNILEPPNSTQSTVQPTIPSAVVEKEIEKTTVIAENLDTPWAIAFLPDKSMLLTERRGAIKHVGIDSEVTTVANLSQVEEIGEGGLMGIALHPQFSSNNYVYLYYTYSGSGNDTLNRVVRMTYKGGYLTDEQIIVDAIPGASNHNGGRIKFGTDNFLYITTGDAEEPSLAQNRNSLAGKILRVTDSGNPAVGNPFGTRIYSYGHRNPQGITWFRDGKLYSTEHGPSGGQFGTGRDELNISESGKNYGWPEIMGDKTNSGMEKPLLHSGIDTWAPAGAAYYKHKDLRDAIFFGGLRGEALYEVNFTGDGPMLVTHFKNEFGRIREVIVGPDNMLYITTSNNDGRGSLKSGDDKIIRINPEKL